MFSLIALLLFKFGVWVVFSMMGIMLSSLMSRKLTPSFSYSNTCNQSMFRKWLLLYGVCGNIIILSFGKTRMNCALMLIENGIYWRTNMQPTCLRVQQFSNIIMLRRHLTLSVWEMCRHVHQPLTQQLRFVM